MIYYLEKKVLPQFTELKKEIFQTVTVNWFIFVRIYFLPNILQFFGVLDRLAGILRLFGKMEREFNDRIHQNVANIKFIEQNLRDFFPKVPPIHF